MIPAQAMLIHTIDVTASLAPATSSVALAAMVCGAVLLALGYDALRADPKGARASGAAETNRSAPSPLDLRASGCAARAA
jgi:hypothetical protein